MNQIDFSNPVVIAILVAIVLAIIIAIAVAAQRKRASERLRQRFGSEYERAVREHGSPTKAEAVLANREARVHKLQVRELAPAQRERFVAEWVTVQSRFVDHPKGAVIEADELVTSLLQARGYNAAGFEESAADISVLYPSMIEDYRRAHSAAARSARGEASTEELRTAMIHYRTLFDELLKSTPNSHRSVA
jgi:hypothetical protein